MLRGVGYESNDASVLTNVSSDHLDLQGIHTLPELAEVKATVCRITKPDGWVVLNADDPFVAGVARRVRARVAFFSIAGRSAVVRRHRAGGGRAYRRASTGSWSKPSGDARVRHRRRRPDPDHDRRPRPPQRRQRARRGRRGARSRRQPRAGPRRAGRLPAVGRAVAWAAQPVRLGARVVIVDFAHNEAGVAAVLDVAEGIAAGAAGRAAPITAIIGTAGDRPDDTLRGIGRIAAERAQRVAIKQTLRYLRGRTAESVVGELLAGVKAGGGDPADVPVYESEPAALRAELNGAAGHGRDGGRADGPRVIVLMCHEDRDGVHAVLDDLGARPVDVATELTELVPRLQGRPRRG